MRSLFCLRNYPDMPKCPSVGCGNTVSPFGGRVCAACESRQRAGNPLPTIQQWKNATGLQDALIKKIFLYTSIQQGNYYQQASPPPVRDRQLWRAISARTTPTGRCANCRQQPASLTYRTTCGVLSRLPTCLGCTEAIVAQRKSSIGSLQDTSTQTGSIDVFDNGEEGATVDVLTPWGWQEVIRNSLKTGVSTTSSSAQTGSSAEVGEVLLETKRTREVQVEEEKGSTGRLEGHSGEAKNLGTTQDAETQTLSSPSTPNTPSTPNSSPSQPQTPPRTLAESIVRNNQGYGPWRSKQSHNYSLDCYEKIWEF